MKVTTKMFYDGFLSGLQSNMEGVLTDSEQITSGKKINRPSDDPTALSRILDYKTGMSSIDAYKKAIAMAANPLQAAESALGNFTTAMTRANELAVGGTSDSMDPASRRMSATEISQILESIIGIANTKVGDNYIFSGYQSNVAPIDATTGEYVSDSNEVNVAISPGMNVAANLPGSDLFSFARTNVTDPAGAVMPSYNWNNNGTITIPDADPNSALYTAKNSPAAYTNPSTDVFTTEGGSATIKVGDSTQDSVGGFVINGNNNAIQIDGVTYYIQYGVYTGAGLADAIMNRLSTNVDGSSPYIAPVINASYDTSTHKFSIASAGAVNVNFGNAATTMGQILGFNPVDKTIGTGIASDNALGDVNLAKNSTLNDVRNAINIAVAGVKAEVVNFNDTTDSTKDDFRLVVASATAGSSDKIKITTAPNTGDSGLDRLNYDPNGTMNMTLGTDKITNYNYITDLTSCDDIVINNGVNDTIMFNDGTSDKTAVVTPGTYTPTQLAAEIDRAMEAANDAALPANSYTVQYVPATGRYQITNNSGANLDMLWEKSETTMGSILGFTSSDHAVILNTASSSSDNATLNSNYYSFNNNYLNENYAVRALNFLKVSLENNDTGRISKAVDYMSKISDKVYRKTSDVGARIDKLDAQGKYLDDRNYDLTTYLSNDQDTDVAKVSADITQKQTALQALRLISVQFLNTSLFDFLK